MTEQRRYHLIDAIRAVAVVNMILFHLYFDVLFLSGALGDDVPPALMIWERCISVTFILVSGISLNFSRHGYRRGIIVAVCAAGVTAGTCLFTPDLTIWFGVLHFLACAMLIGTALKPVLNRIRPAVGMAVFFTLYMLFYGITDGYLGLFTVRLITLPSALYRYKWLSVVGLLTDDFASGDYFPLIPLIFLYLFGFYLWRYLKERSLDELFYRRIPVLDFIGRHSLIIYLVHQPILYGICWLILGGSS